MARLLIGLPAGLMAISLLRVLWLLVAQFTPALSSETMALAWPFLARSLIYALVTSSGQVLVGLLAAFTVLWLARSRASQLAMITVYLIPYAIPASVIALAVRFALGAQSAWADIVSPIVGVEPGFWLYQNTFTIAVLVSIWQFFPFAFLLSFLALRTIPSETLRAAQLDGAPFMAMVRDIVLRRIWSVLMAIFGLRLVFMLVKFDTPFVFTEKIASVHDVATIELWRAIGGSTSPELTVIAWGLQLFVLSVSLLYVSAHRRVAR